MHGNQKTRLESAQVPNRKSTSSTNPSAEREVVVKDRRPTDRGYNPDPLLTTKEAATYLGLKPCTLEKWRCQGIGPEWERIGTKSIRYHLSALDACIKEGGNA